MEGGVKGGTPGGTVDFTAAVYKIRHDDILTPTGIQTLSMSAINHRKAPSSRRTSS